MPEKYHFNLQKYYFSSFYRGVSPKISYDPIHDKLFDTLMLSVSKYMSMITTKLKNMGASDLIYHGELHPD